MKLETRLSRTEARPPDRRLGLAALPRARRHPPAGGCRRGGGRDAVDLRGGDRRRGRGLRLRWSNRAAAHAAGGRGLLPRADGVSRRRARGAAGDAAARRRSAAPSRSSPASTARRTKAGWSSRASSSGPAPPRSSSISIGCRPIPRESGAGGRSALRRYRAQQSAQVGDNPGLGEARTLAVARPAIMALRMVEAGARGAGAVQPLLRARHRPRDAAAEPEPRTQHTRTRSARRCCGSRCSPAGRRLARRDQRRRPATRKWSSTCWPAPTW